MADENLPAWGASMRERERARTESEGARALLLEISPEVSRAAEAEERRFLAEGTSLAELRTEWAMFEQELREERALEDGEVSALAEPGDALFLARRVAYARAVDDLLREETGDGLYERHLMPSEDGVSFRDGPIRPALTFPNQLPHLYKREQAAAMRRGVVPVSARDEEKLARLAEQGTLKFVVTLEREVLFGPMHIKHPVLARGKPVLSAGEAELVFLARGKGFYVAELNHHSGHYRPLKSSLLHATEAMRRAGFTVPAGAEKERMR